MSILDFKVIKKIKKLLYDSYYYIVDKIYELNLKLNVVRDWILINYNASSLLIEQWLVVQRNKKLIDK